MKNIVSNKFVRRITRLSDLSIGKIRWVGRIKKLTLCALIFLPAICSAQTSAFIMGGVSIGKTFSPSGEAGFYCELNRFKVGMNFTYTSVRHTQANPDIILDNPVKAKSQYTAAISLGPVLTTGKLNIMPAAEMGAVFSDKENGAYMGIRTDFKYRLKGCLSLISGVYLSHARLKAAATNYGARAGISIAL